ncbi:MAG: caspase family protein [Gammaproteobacteria bacterium]|nr:caspase family protein [Gammaproteobacteria bacterium]
MHRNLLPHIATLTLLLSTALVQAATCNMTQTHPYNACPDSPLAAYNQIQQLREAGDTSAARQLTVEASRKFPRFTPLQQLQRIFNDPYGVVGELTAARLRNWYESYTPPLFSRQPPEKPELPPLPQLVKGEFETTPAFKQRVEQARRERQATIKRIERDYSRAVTAYNRAVEEYNQVMENSLAQHKGAREQRHQEYLQQAIAEVLGKPTLAELQYDADRQQFSGHLQVAGGSLDYPVTVPVPLQVARQFKQQQHEITPEITYTITNGPLQMETIHAPFKGNNYPVALESSATAPQQLRTVQLQDDAIPDFDALSTMSPEQFDTTTLASESDFFDTALALEADPELAKLKQQQAELQRQQREAQLAQARQQEKARLQQQILQQQQQLAQLGGDAGDNWKGQQRKVKWQFNPAREDNRDTVAVIIGNRNYSRGVPLVHYAHNDARAMKQFVSEGLGLAPENIIYEEDATRGTMDGIFRSTLPARVAAGANRVLVYFSGHGMVDDQQAMLLPTDARPSTAKVTGYNRDRLLQQLASLDREVTLILDACYTGTTKEGKPMVQGKPIFNAPVTPDIPAKVVMITASRGNQIAWMDDKTGHSLLTYHLLKGLSGEADGNHDSVLEREELEGYLSLQVNRNALRLHEQRQEPAVEGKRSVILKL